MKTVAEITATKSQTSRHFAEGERVYHKTYGFGVVRVSAYNGRDKYPFFEETRTTGTPSTRVWSAS